jgi:tetratricopeptide (TPR) repeat protein
LAVAEQQVLKRLAVFRGGFEREVAAQVAGASLSLLLGLLSKSLVRRSATGRYDMHELVRQFAAEKLAQEDEAVAAQRQHHTHYYLMLVEQAEPELRGSNQVAWSHRLEVELDNLRAALAWTIEHCEAELGLRLGAGLGWFWRIRGHLTEGRDWLAKVLALPCAQPWSIHRAKALNAAGLLAYYQVDYTGARALYEESVIISEACADDMILAQSLHGLGNVLWYQNYHTEALSLLEKSLDLYCQLNDQAGVAASLSRLGAMAGYGEDYETARRLSEQSLNIFRALGDKWGTVYALWNLAEATIYGQHDYEAARLLFEQCLAIAREVQDKLALTAALVGLADLALVRQDYSQVEAYAGEGLSLSRQIGDQWQPPRMMRLLGYAALQRGQANQALPLFIETIQLNQLLNDRRGVIAGLVALARFASSQQQHNLAAQWLGAVETALTTIKDQLLPADQTIYEQTITATQSQLNPECFKATWAKGAHLTLEEAIQLELAPYGKTSVT